MSGYLGGIFTDLLIYCFCMLLGFVFYHIINDVLLHFIANLEGFRKASVSLRVWHVDFEYVVFVWQSVYLCLAICLASGPHRLVVSDYLEDILAILTSGHLFDLMPLWRLLLSAFSFRLIGIGFVLNSL